MTLGDQLPGRVEQVPPSGTRKFFGPAEEVDDVTSLGVDEPDFSAPWVARMTAIDLLERGKTSCTPNHGMREPCEATSKCVTCYGQERSPEDEIIVTTGASETVDPASRAFVNSGNVVVIPQPSYISYTPGAIFTGGESLPVPTHVEDEFKPTPKVLGVAGADETDVLMLCYPDNPTSAVMTDDELTDVAPFARGHDLVVLSGKICSDLRYEDDHAPIATHPGMCERIIVFNGFSKVYAMTGLRLGYTMGPLGAIDVINKVHQHAMLSAPMAAQYAVFEVLRSYDDSIEGMRREYNRCRRLVLACFEETGPDRFEAKGAFYAFPEAPDCGDEALAEGLLEERNVALVLRSVSGEGGADHPRVSYVTGTCELREAMDHIKAYVSD